MKLEYTSAQNKQQVNTPKFWDKKGINVPNPQEFLMESKIPRWVATYAKPDATIVDLGGSDGAMLDACKAFLPEGKFVCVDYSQRAIDRGTAAYPYIDFILGDASEHAKTMKPVDVIVCNHTLEHFEEPGPFLTRMLKRAKYVVIGVPYRNAYDCEEHMVYFDDNAFDDCEVLQKTVLKGQSFELVLRGEIK